MNIQYILALTVIVLAVAYAAITVLRKRHSFSPKSGCDSDCGCNGASKKLPS